MIAAWRFGYRQVLAVVIAVALVTRIVGTQLSFATVLENPVKDSILGRIDDFMIGDAGDEPKFTANQASATFLLVMLGVSLLSYKFIEFPRRTWRTLMRTEDQMMFPLIAGFRRS